MGRQGSGRPHIRALLWREEEDKAPLPIALKATLDGEDEDFRGVVAGAQKGASGEGGRDVWIGESKWGEETETRRLRHTDEGAEAGIRTYFADITDALRCHQGAQICDKKGALRAYVAKYVFKFSDSSSAAWLDNFPEACHVAANVLYRCRPYGPDMVLQLFGTRYRQWGASTETRGERAIYTPAPDQAGMPAFVDRYVQRAWNGGDMA